MINSKYISAIVAVLVCLALAGSLMMVSAAGTAVQAAPEYEKRLFNGEVVTIAIEVDPDDWQSLLDNAQSKEYISADIVINGDRFTSIGIRTKGNSSLTTGAQAGSGRYSLQLNPNKYVSGQSFYGLDTMCLNNVMGDATYMKDYISYEIMDFLDVPSALHSYADVTVNGEHYGFCLLLERYDDSFLDREYNATTGELYNVKMQMGERSQFAAGNFEPVRPDGEGGQGGGMPQFSFGAPPEGMENMQPPDGMELPDFGDFGDITEGQFPFGGGADDGGVTGGEGDTGGWFGNGFGGGGGMMGGFSSGGGSLVYTDDDPASYGSIFNNAVSSKVSDNDQKQVITAIEKLNAGEDLEDYWDVDEILRYLAAHTFVVNLDSYVSNMQQNYYLLERDGVISVLPWDYNLAFGGYTSSSASSVVNFPIDTPVSGVSMEDRPLVSRLLAVEEYLERYHGYLAEIVEGYVESGLFEETVNALDETIGSYVQGDSSAYYTHDEYQTALAAFKELVTLRAESVAGQLDGSIPATTEGQSADSSALVDASSITLADLGSMGGGGRGGQAGMNGMPDWGVGRENRGFDRQQAGTGGDMTPPADNGSQGDSTDAPPPASGDGQSGDAGGGQAPPDGDQGGAAPDMAAGAQMALEQNHAAGSPVDPAPQGGAEGPAAANRGSSPQEGTGDTGDAGAPESGAMQAPPGGEGTEGVGGMPNGGTIPEGGAMPSDSGAMPGGMNGQGVGGNRQDGGGEVTALPGMTAGQIGTGATQGGVNWVLYAALGALLLAAMLFIALYPRRRWAGGKPDKHKGD